MRMQHEVLEPLSPEQLAKCHEMVLSDYPEERLQLTLGEWYEVVANGYVLPEGPWTIDKYYEGRETERPIEPIYSAENPMGPEAIAKWKRLGLRYDIQTGLPIHPYAKQLLTTPGLGAFTQVGAFYGPGPNNIGNAQLRRERSGVVEYAAVAVMRDAPKGTENEGKKVPWWSGAGGHFDPGKDRDVLAGAFREGYEELGIKIGDIAGLTVIRYEDKPQYAWGATIHAWMQEAHFFAASATNPGLEGYEDLVPQDKEVVGATWMTREEMDNPKFTVMDSFKAMVDQHETNLSQRAA